MEFELQRFKNRLQERKYFERRKLLQSVDGLVRTLDSTLTTRFGLNEPLLESMSELNFRLQSKGVTRENSRRGIHRDIRDSLVSLSPLSQLSSNLGIRADHLELECSFPPTSSGNFHGWVNVDIGKDLIIRKSVEGKRHELDTVELTIPGKDYIYISEDITIDHKKIDPDGKSIRYKCTAFVTDHGDFSQQVFCQSSIYSPEVASEKDILPYDDDSLAAFQAHVVDFTKLVGSLGLQSAA